VNFPFPPIQSIIGTINGGKVDARTPSFVFPLKINLNMSSLSTSVKHEIFNKNILYFSNVEKVTNQIWK
jgi:hypothetical protein